MNENVDCACLCCFVLSTFEYLVFFPDASEDAYLFIFNIYLPRCVCVVSCFGFLVFQAPTFFGGCPRSGRDFSVVEAFFAISSNTC